MLRNLHIIVLESWPMICSDFILFSFNTLHLIVPSCVIFERGNLYWGMGEGKKGYPLNILGSTRIEERKGLEC